MTINFKILDRKVPNEDGYMIVIIVSHKQIRREREIGRAFLTDWDVKTSSYLETHPEYDSLMPALLALKIKASKILSQYLTDAD